MALTLARAGFKVVVLEKGHLYKTDEFVHDEILNSRRNFFMPYPWEEPHLIRYNGDERVRAQQRRLARQLRGRRHGPHERLLLPPQARRLSHASMLGAPAGSEVVDWPITYDDLAPFYDKAEAELGVSGVAEPHPFAEPRSKPFPLPPLEDHPIAKEIDRVCKELRLAPAAPPRAAS